MTSTPSTKSIFRPEPELGSMQPSAPMTKSWYRTWFDSPYYHILYSNHDETEAHQFINSLLTYLQPAENAKILDLACGKGRYSRFLAQKGYSVTGIDLSATSIQEARAFEGPHLSFYQHDMRLPYRFNYFNFIFNFFTSFGYFDLEKEDLKVLKNVCTGLESEGKFVLDFFNSFYVTRHLLGEEVKVRSGIEFSLLKYIEAGFIFKDIHFEVDGTPYVFRERVRLYALEDFQRLFDQANLKIVSTFGDYHLNAYKQEESPRLILLAEK